MQQRCIPPSELGQRLQWNMIDTSASGSSSVLQPLLPSLTAYPLWRTWGGRFMASSVRLEMCCSGMSMYLQTWGGREGGRVSGARAVGEAARVLCRCSWVGTSNCPVVCMGL